MRKRIWKEYNRQLIERGSITFLVDPKTMKAITQYKPKSTGGRPKEYPSALIELLLIVKIQFSLTYRALEGFVKSIFKAFKKGFVLPSYSTICKRAKELVQKLPKLSCRKPKVVLLDSSGIKVFGEGEWKRKVHGVGRPRKWLKMHIAVDERSQEIVAEQLTESCIADSSMVKPLVDSLSNSLEIVKADGAYDRRESREAIRCKGARGLIPPPRNAKLHPHRDERNTSIKEIKGFGGDELARSIWGKLSGYSYRALVETAFSRYKRLFGGRLFSRTPERRIIENRLKWVILNKMVRV